MARLKLSLETGNGEYHTLAGVGIISDILEQAMTEVGADSSDVVLRFRDGNLGARVDIMYPTPHTMLFEGVKIENGHLTFHLGRAKWLAREPSHRVPLADPDIAKEIAKIIQEKAKTHKRLRKALKC